MVSWNESEKRMPHHVIGVAYLIRKARKAQQEHNQKHDVQLEMQDCPICFKPFGNCECSTEGKKDE